LLDSVQAQRFAVLPRDRNRWQVAAGDQRVCEWSATIWLHMRFVQNTQPQREESRPFAKLTPYTSLH
jgi:hypothetical protein